MDRLWPVADIRNAAIRAVYRGWLALLPGQDERRGLPRPAPVIPQPQRGHARGADWRCAIRAPRPPSRSAFTTTDTELRLIASAAIMGVSSQPVSG